MSFVVHVSVLVERDGQLLLVQEHSGLWNLPGGGLQPGERLVEGAVREVREETGLSVQPGSLIGIYTGLGAPHRLNFVFHALARAGAGGAPGDGIRLMRWAAPADVLESPDSMYLNPRKLKQVVKDLARPLPLNVIREDVYGTAASCQLP